MRINTYYVLSHPERKWVRESGKQTDGERRESGDAKVDSRYRAHDGAYIKHTKTDR
jgi:hypothetical protein